jgi:hypothetical protein
MGNRGYVATGGGTGRGIWVRGGWTGVKGARGKPKKKCTHEHVSRGICLYCGKEVRDG